jgi:hypothetical protein
MRQLADYGAIWLIPTAESLIRHIFASIMKLIWRHDSYNVTIMFSKLVH